MGAWDWVFKDNSYLTTFYILSAMEIESPPLPDQIQPNLGKMYFKK